MLWRSKNKLRDCLAIKLPFCLLRIKEMRVENYLFFRFITFYNGHSKKTYHDIFRNFEPPRVNEFLLNKNKIVYLRFRLSLSNCILQAIFFSIWSRFWSFYEIQSIFPKEFMMMGMILFNNHQQKLLRTSLSNDSFINYMRCMLRQGAEEWK